MSSGGGGGSGGFDQAPSTSMNPQQPPSLQHGWGEGGGGVAQLTPSAPADEDYVAYVGQDPQFGHSGGCSQHGRPGDYGPTAMFSGAGSVAAAPSAPCPNPAVEVQAGAIDTVAPSAFPAQRDDEAPREQDVDVIGGGGHGQMSVYPWMIPGRPVDNTPGPVVETRGLEVDPNRFERGVQIRGGGPRCPVDVEAAHTSSGSGIDGRVAQQTSLPIAATRRVRCQYEQCPNIPKYGAKDASPRFCRAHKRIGMYFASAGGKWMIATRNGDGIRLATPAVLPGGGGGAMTRSAFNYGCRPVMPGFSLAPKRGVCAVQRPTGPGDNRTRPDLAAMRTLSLAGPSVARPNPIVERGRIECDYPGCRVRPNVSITDRKPARFCFKHRKKPVSLRTKSPVCIHQGCNVQPHYGLPMGRQLYCAQHKGDGMVCILKGGLVLAIENATRKKADTFANRSLHQGGNGYTVEGIEGPNTDANSKLNRGGHFPGHRQDTASPAYGLPQADSPTESGSPPSRTVYGSDTSPSADMELLKKARQSAQAEAEASGNGKRAKTPSRKALEASGVAGVVQDAPQHMTKEMSDAARKTTSSRMTDQRPGLEGNWDCFAGRGTGNVAGNGGFIGRFGGGGFSRVGDLGDDVLPCVGEILEEYLGQRRQYNQEEQQQQQQQQQQRQEQQQQHDQQHLQQQQHQLQRILPSQQQQRQSSALQTSHQPKSPTDATGVFSTINPRPVRSPKRGTDNAIANKTDKTNKRRGGVSGNTGKRKAKKNASSGLKNNIGGLNSGGLKNTNDELHNGRGKEGVRRTRATKPCEIDDCESRATYGGVDSIGRFCYDHRLYGMYRIP